MKYSDIIEEHFANPQNVGELQAADATGSATNEVCLDKLQLWLRLENGGVVAEATFRAEGCVPSIAMGSFLSQWLRGKHVAELRKLDADDLENAVGGLPRNKKHAAQLGVDAIQDAIQNFDRKGTGR